MGSDKAFDLVSFLSRRFDVDKPHLGSRITQWCVNKVAADAGVFDFTHFG